MVKRSGECKGWWMRDGTRSGSKKGECTGCGKRRCKGWKGGVGARVGGKGMIARGGARAFESKQ